MTRTWPAAAAFSLILAACGGSAETARVTERPQRTEAEVVVVTQRPTGSTETAATAQDAVNPLDTVTVGRFDTGRMWTFENPPVEYFREAYGFSPDTAWFNRARLGALRFATYCSASFVSPHGLVMTNHHCARESITSVSRAGENLLDNGFYAASLEAERKVEDLYVDQLISMGDVTAEVYDRIRTYSDDQQRAEALEETTEGIETRLTNEAKEQDTTLYVQVIELYNGGRYSAYTFRRYRDVRLVMAPEHQIGSFGGDPDNFTYPRYSLDMSFFRVYDYTGKPLAAENFFPFSADGSSVDELVFVVGSPGSTSRLNTVAQLEYERDYDLPQQLEVLHSRAEILARYIEENGAEADSFDLRNEYFSLRNSIKALEGQLRGLQDPALINRRAAAERTLQQEIAGNDSLRRLYGSVLQDLQELQRSKEATSSQAGAFTYFGADVMESHVLLRSLYGFLYAFLQQRGAGEDQLKTYREGGLNVANWPAEVEEAFLAARLREIQRYFGESDPTVRRVLGGRTPEAVAREVIAGTALIDSAGFARTLATGYFQSNDPTVPIIQAIAPLYFAFNEQVTVTQDREQNLNARLARARFAVSGTDIPPDASFSLRISDGVVRPYMYNGTLAPAYTTMFGLYEHHYSYADSLEDWDLTERWLDPPRTLDRSTPINLVTTNDITGGNSGSPLLNRDLEVVGLAFDSNVEALPNVYLYRDDTGARAISVDSRGILEALDDIYDADRIVLELTQRRLAPTETEADEILSAR